MAKATMSDIRPTVDPKTLGRLDALPGSLGKVTLCAVFTLGIAAFVSVRRWMAARTADPSAAGPSKYGLRSKLKPSSNNGGSNANANNNINNNSNGGGGLSGRGDESNRDGAAGGSPSPPQRPQLPPRNYFTIRASLHVKRHNAKLMEWYDEQLGMQLPFSPQLFELKQEERQAPLILLTFRTVREATHRMAVTIEELYESQTAAAYCEASLGRIADCARVLGTSTTRIGNREFPAAEYCYLDETQKMVFVFSLFVVHERLAVTLQYVAPTRVRNVMPTAFYDLARLLTFTAPSPSPSYLLVSEPRLGLGYHLPLDFLVHEGLAESDGVEDRLFTSVGAGNAGGGPLSPSGSSGGGGLHQHPPMHHQLQQSENSPSRGFGGGPLHRPFQRSYGGDSDWVIPYATAMSRGGRRMGLITSYEPALSLTSGAADPFTTAVPPSSANASGVPYVWRQYLEQQVCKAVRQLGIYLGPHGDAYGAAPRVVFPSADPAETAAYTNAGQTLLMEPYPLSVALNGNFSSNDDGREEDGEAVSVTAFSLFREVRIDVNSSYVTLVPDTLDAVTLRSSRSTAAGSGGAAAAAGGAAAVPATVKAYWSAFYVPVGTACVSFHFIASALRHTSTEFVSFCAAVMNSVSLGNHYGQAVSVLYCNTRHDVLPFRLSLPPTGMATVEEPMLADPLCVVQATYGVEKTAVTVRVFPLFAATTNAAANTAAAAAVAPGAPATTINSNNAGGGRSGTPAAATPGSGSLDARSTSPSKPPAAQMVLLRPGERRGTRQRSAMRQLQSMTRYYLNQFPGGVHVVSYTRTTVNSMPAVLLCFRPLYYTAEGAVEGGDGARGLAMNNWDDFGNGGGGVGGGGSSQGASSWLESRDAMLEDEVGQLNPFAQYFPPPPPPASYLWAQQSQQQQQQQQGGVTAAAVKKAGMNTSATLQAAGGEPQRDGDGDFFYPHGSGDSQRSMEEMDAPLRVALAVCCEGNAFLFQTPASEYTLGIAQQAVQTTATYLAPIPRGS